MKLVEKLVEKHLRDQQARDILAGITECKLVLRRSRIKCMHSLKLRALRLIHLQTKMTLAAWKVRDVGYFKRSTIGQQTPKVNASSGLTVQPAQENPRLPERWPHHLRKEDGLVQASSSKEAWRTVALMLNLYPQLHAFDRLIARSDPNRARQSE